MSGWARAGLLRGLRAAAGWAMIQTRVRAAATAGPGHDELRTTAIPAGDMRHVLSILLQNHPGALARVSTMFASRGFNIESLSVAPTEDDRVSRLTLVTTGSDDVIGQINKQMAKLVEVVAIADRTEVDHLERELCLLKLRVPAESAEAMRKEVANFGARILVNELDSLVLELTGTEAQIDGFMADLPGGVEVLSVVRSGSMAISKGPRSLSDDLDHLFEDESLLKGG